jgi:hypothetical protein
MASGSERYLEIYRRRETGELFVQAFWNKPTGGATVQDNPVPLGSEPSNDEIGHAVKAALDAFVQPFDLARTTRLPEWKGRTFADGHDIVFVERLPTSETLVGHMRRVPGGFEGTKKTARLGRRTTMSGIVAAIRTALRQAGTV